MPKHSTLTSSTSVPAGASVDDLCQQFWSHQVDLDLASANAGKRRHKKFRAAVRDELERRLGDRTDEVLEEYAAGYLYEESKQSAPSQADSPPRRVRRPQVMYVEQKTDGNRDLQDRGPAAVGEVSFSKSGRTAYFNGKTFHRAKGGYGNYQCVEDGNRYWISGEARIDTGPAEGQSPCSPRWIARVGGVECPGGCQPRVLTWNGQ
jgi:hypothetical protein